jgi:hypothetical protein
MSPAGPSLEEVVERVAHFLPAQGPISVFIHHNTLHAFEDHDFEDAVVLAGRRFGCEPFLAEEDYREALRSGRILAGDVAAVIEAELGARGEEPVAGEVSRHDLWNRILSLGIPPARGHALAWLLSETDALSRFRADLPALASEALRRRSRGEAGAVAALWEACLATVARVPGPPPTSPLPPIRHRDHLLGAHGIDIDEPIDPVLIRFTSAYLDQGLAHREMPGRDRGFYGCFVALYGRRWARLGGAWARHLVAAIADDRCAGRDPAASLRHSLSELGVAEPEWEGFLLAEALALRGWAGMVRQIEVRPDRVPAVAVPARLLDFLAVRLLLCRASLTHAAAHLEVPLAELRESLADRIPAPPAPSTVDRAWPLFHAAQLAGLDVTASPAMALEALEVELAALDPMTRRRLLHLAYERHLRHRFYDALTQHRPPPDDPAPAFQAIFCIDEREESLRRHLEEIDPGVETFGAAGFFGVAMYFRGATDAHPRPLCPVALQPRHLVTEDADRSRGLLASWRRTRRRLTALVDKNVHVGSRTFGRGAVIMAVLGVLWIVPLVLRVIVPWSRRGLSRVGDALERAPAGRLRLERAADAPAGSGALAGFTVEEMVAIARGQLAPLGIAGRFAPLVLVLGHGSSSLNNPQESAHDCGACGGGHGGPNARAFAQMANDPRVRARLAELGVHIPAATWFVGGERNTATNDVDLFDEDRVPERARRALERARASLEVARRREAHERCRRFEAVPTWLPPRAALLHVQTRATDLAQPRPEYGHATNAVCVVGRRAATRGLFLDRRSFLVSYDPMGDPDGAALAPLLAAVVPVLAGINLEYYFGSVDPTGYGCGTKLPHNITSLLGVMDGAQSDLRPGLPWQMLEIHEPVRLTLAIEAGPDVVLALLERDANLRRLVDHRWLHLACLDPESRSLFEIDAAGARRYEPEQRLATVSGTSLTHYRGRRGPLPFATIAGTAAESGSA